MISIETVIKEMNKTFAFFTITNGKHNLVDIKDIDSFRKLFNNCKKVEKK